MDWDLDKTGIYIAVSYIGLIDEFAIFKRALTEDEIRLLRAQPAVLSTSQAQVISEAKVRRASCASEALAGYCLSPVLPSERPGFRGLRHSPRNPTPMC